MGTKENNGKAARRKLYNRLSSIAALFGGVLTLAALLRQRRQHHTDYGNNGGMSAQHIDGDDELRYDLRLAHPFRDRGRDTNNNADSAPLLRRGGEGRRIGNDPAIEAILRGKLTLVDIRVPHDFGSDSSRGVVGSFCAVDWSAHKQDPSSTPMFRDVIARSNDCDLPKEIPLSKVVAAARAYDNNVNNVGSSGEGGKVLNLTAAVFHESRCGSTLAANVFVAMDPVRHRVYSESPPPVAALKACGETYGRCPIETAAALLRDVVYLMSRTDDDLEERVFFKIQSIGSLNIPVFQTAFPNTPWIYVFRDPVQVMMSHIGHGNKKAVCTRKRDARGGGGRAAFAAMSKVGTKVGRTDHPRSWSLEDFCAGHLATLTESAAASLFGSSSSTGASSDPQKYAIPLNYEGMADRLMEEIIPLRLGLTVGTAEMDRIRSISGKYSKGRGNKAGDFTGDSEGKEARASDEIRAAAATFMKPSYEQLQAIAEAQREEYKYTVA